MTTPDLHIGGGDDWMPLSTDVERDRDHVAVGPTVGNVSQCRVPTCRGGIVLRQEASGRYVDQDKPGAWQHVKAFTAAA